MKRLLILLIVLLLILTGCNTVPQNEPFQIPEFLVPPPTRPMLETIPTDTQGTIKTLTINMSRLVKHIEKWEMYDLLKDTYNRQVRLLFTTLN